jgi:hypothetical protein
MVLFMRISPWSVFAPVQAGGLHQIASLLYVIGYHISQERRSLWAFSQVGF